MKYYKREKTEYGNYVDQAGDKYTVLWCSAIYSPSKKTPEDFGYELFEDEEAALEAWGLVPYIDPEETDEVIDIDTIEEKENN
jgi:hypothetical protein